MLSLISVMSMLSSPSPSLLPKAVSLAKTLPPRLLPPPEVEPASVDLDLDQHLLCQPTSLDSSLSVNLNVP